MLTKLTNLPPKTYALAALCALLAFVSALGIAPVMEKPETYPATIASLDHKRDTVVEMSAALIGISVVIAAVPGDATTPVANQISQLNSYLIIVLGSIMLEKFLLPIIALIVWRGIIPIGLVLFGLFFLFEKRLLRSIAIHAFILGAAMMCLIPCGVKLGNMIDDSFGTDDLLGKIKTDVQELSDEITSSAQENITAAGEKVKGDSAKTKKKQNTEDQGIFEQIAGFGKSITEIGDSINDLKENISDSITSLGSTFTEAAAEAIAKAKLIMGDLMDAVAILLVTVCVIPVATLFALIGLVKFIFGLLLKQMGEW